MCNKSYLEAFHFLQFFLHYKAKDIVQSKHITWMQQQRTEGKKWETNFI